MIEVPTSFAEQVWVVVYAFGLKPLYMVLSLVLGLSLWGKTQRDLVLLRRGLLVFLAGEAMCSVNYLFASGRSLVFELSHQVGMIGMGMYLSWGLFSLIDSRFLGYCGPQTTCSLQRLCKRCWKRESTVCGPHQLMQLALVMLCIVCLIPLLASVPPHAVTYRVLDSLVQYVLTREEIWAQYRLYPLLAIGSFGLALVLLRRGIDGVRLAQGPFFFGLGAGAFSLLRFFLFSAFHNAPFWAASWEEVTELLMVVGIGTILWTFRAQLELWGRAVPSVVKTSQS